jgi:hypothetical protein
MSRRAKIEQIVFSAIDDLNRHRQENEKVVPKPETLIMGPGSALDSLGLVTLCVDLEERVQREFGKSPQLVAALVGKGGGASVSSLIELVDSLLHE